MWWILVAVAVLTLVYWKIVRPHKYWTEKGVKQGNPRFITGESWGILFKTQTAVEMIEMIYKTCPNDRYSGFYQFLLPTLMIRDPDLIKQMTVKDFDHFTDHQVFLPEDADPLWAKNLFALTGKKWRDMRVTLSPAFTSSKMKYMFSLISKSGEQFVKNFLDKNEDVITLEMKDTFTRFANDVIANTAFGVDCDSLGERNNEFYLMGKEATDFSGFWKNFKFFLCISFPGISKFIDVRLFSTAVAKFFITLIKSNIESREKHNIVRPDMIHLLLETRKNGLKLDESQPEEDTGFATVEESEITKGVKTDKQEMTDVDITSQALLFFFAGFETTSTLMCFMAYELGVNPDIQERLIEEVDKTMRTCNGKITYEALVKMKYMDMVVSEALRKWPPVITTDRICTIPYTIEPKSPDEKPLYLEKNTALWLPVYAIHHDPQYYPNPERFDPERFNDENKDKIQSYTFLPFGAGPRNCIGSRFALLETKILFCYILHNFQIVSVPETPMPMVLSKQQFNITAEKGFWLGLKRRCN